MNLIYKLKGLLKKAGKPHFALHSRRAGMRHIAVLTGVETTAAFKVLYIMEKNGKPVAVLFRRAKKIETVFEA